jgi:hypothetical protein
MNLLPESVENKLVRKYQDEVASKQLEIMILLPESVENKLVRKNQDEVASKQLEIMNLLPESVENKLVRKNQDEVASHVEKEERVVASESESPEQKRQKHGETGTLKVNDTTTTILHVTDKRCGAAYEESQCQGGIEDFLDMY